MNRSNILVLAFLSSAYCISADVRIELRHSGLDEQPRAESCGTLTLRRGDAGANPLTLNVEVPGSVAAHLEPGLYMAGLDAPGWWIPSQLVVGRDSTKVTMPARRLVSLRGELEGSEPAGELSVRFAESTDPAITGEAQCAAGRTDFRCDLPEGTWDLRLSRPGDVPHYRWQVRIEAGKDVDLGRFRFAAGASLSGYLQSEEDSLGNVNLTLTPSSGKPVHTAVTPAQNGFFQFGPVAPGKYTLTAAQKQLITAPRQVEIRERLEARVRDPLVLAKPRRVAVDIAPPVTPIGRPWVVMLAGVEDGAVAAESEASLAGAWTAENVPRGTYQLRIRPEGGPVWHVENLPVDEPMTARSITLPSTRFRGTVTLGGRPLAAAKVTLGGAHSARRIPWRSDERGRFEGYLPVPPDGRWIASVKSDAPSVNSTLEVVMNTKSDVATIDIALPGTSIDGKVVDENGGPTKNALINISGARYGLVQVKADDDGAFQVLGLPHDDYRISAAMYLSESDAVQVDLSDRDAEPVSIRLQVTPYRQWKGRVTDIDGRPVEGARVVASATDVQAVVSYPARSDASGRFTLLVPKAARMFDVQVKPPGHALTIQRRPLTDELTVMVTRNGGTLVLEFDARATAWPNVHHAGAAFSANGLISGWPGTIEDVAEGTLRVRLPRMNPGDYTVCMGQPPSGPCRSVFLAPHGEAKIRLGN